MLAVYILLAAFGLVLYLRYGRHTDVIVRGWTGQSHFRHAHHLVLEKYFFYYRNLSHPKKLEFERRVAQFIDSKEFIARGEMNIGPEVETLIAASAVQLTFGLPFVALEHFDKIIVFPDTFFSKAGQRYHKGEVNPRVGVIALSWKSFLEGYINPSDSYNLGLHEMAHALKLENYIPNDEFGFLKEEVLREIDLQYIELADDIQTNPESFLRAYAGVNEEEFFAVAVENFFERPQQMKERLPKLYSSMSRLLGQDPVGA